MEQSSECVEFHPLRINLIPYTGLLTGRLNPKFKLSDLWKHVDSFGFMVGIHRTFRDQSPANIKAVDLVGKLYNTLDKSHYKSHDLAQFLIRIVFCLFADDTLIFAERDMFPCFIEDRTRKDGSDVGAKLDQLFQVLNEPENDRQSTLDEDLNRFPYINGDLFKDRYYALK